MKKLPISAVIIAKNEEDRIARALKSVAFCAEIIVIDSNSTDRTAEISISLGAKVFQQAFLGYGNQKNFGFEKAQQPWILSLDADEEVSTALAQELEKAIQRTFLVFDLPRKNYFLGQALKYGKESNDRLIRFFKKGAAQYGQELVHEKIQTHEKVGHLIAPLHHHTYRSMEHATAKMGHYAQLGAQALKAKGKKRNRLFIFIFYPFYFLKHYVIYGNFLNGKAGYQWSKLMANYHSLKYKKLQELS